MQVRVTRKPYMTAFEKALVESTHKKLREDPAAGQGLAELIMDSERGDWSRYLMQSSFGLDSLRDVYEAHAFVLAMTKLYSGQIAMCAIRSDLLAGGPESDSNVAGNSKRLSALPAPFTAVFDPTRGRDHARDVGRRRRRYAEGADQAAARSRGWVCAIGGWILQRGACSRAPFHAWRQPGEVAVRRKRDHSSGENACMGGRVTRQEAHAKYGQRVEASCDM